MPCSSRATTAISIGRRSELVITVPIDQITCKLKKTIAVFCFLRFSDQAYTKQSANNGDINMYISPINSSANCQVTDSPLLILSATNNGGASRITKLKANAVPLAILICFSAFIRLPLHPFLRRVYYRRRVTAHRPDGEHRG